MPELPKAHRRGCHRALAPRETLERLRPLLPSMGITRVADITGLDRIGIPVFVACRPNSRALAVSQGKGLDADAARVSAIMESAESFHAERIERPLELASWRELSARRPVVDASKLVLSAGSVFHPDRTLLWLCGEHWSDGSPVWVPYQLVHTRYTRGFVHDPPCFIETSTGLASGNHRHEAVLHAACEAVERDAMHRFHQLDADARDAWRVDLDSVDDADCRDTLARFARAGIAVAVWEITGPVGLPAFECLIVEGDDDAWTPVPASGYGCHPTRGIALLRALTEAAQSRLTMISGSRDDISRHQVDEVCRPGNVRAQRETVARAGRRPFAAAPDFVHDSFDADLSLVHGRLRDAGFGPPVVVDLSRPEFFFSVVRVVVPGLTQATV